MNLSLEMSKLPEPPNDSRPPHWDYWRHDLWTRAQADDATNFMAWPCVYHTMLVNHWNMILEFGHLNQDIKRWQEVILPHVGQPLDGGQNMINQAYHLKLWEDHTGLKTEELNTIVEFGGGYGAMALLCHRLGFRGRYVIYDLPEFSLLQQWFLEQEGVQGIEWLGQPVDADLLIALYSLSEVSLKDRDRFLNEVEFKHHLYLYSAEWVDYDNVTYFGRLKGERLMCPRKKDWYLLR